MIDVPKLAFTAQWHSTCFFSVVVVRAVEHVFLNVVGGTVCPLDPGANRPLGTLALQMWFCLHSATAGSCAAICPSENNDVFRIFRGLGGLGSICANLIPRSVDPLPRLDIGTIAVL